MPSQTETARTVKQGLSALKVKQRVRLLLAMDLLSCEPDKIEDIRAQNRALDKVFIVLNSMLREYETGGNASK